MEVLIYITCIIIVIIAVIIVKKKENTQKTVKHLYHYTKLDSLSNILKTNEFIFSNFIDANDYKEKSVKYKDEISLYKYISFTYNIELKLYSYTNAPLWYFYAEKGGGACICFDKQKLLSKFNPIKEGFINYKNGVTRINAQTIDEFLMEKRKDWAYENEYRMLVNSNYNSIPNILECISAIYIGAEVSEEKIKTIYQNIPDTINVFQMYIDKTDGRYNHIDYRKKMELTKRKSL